MHFRLSSAKWKAATRCSARPFTTKTGARVHFFPRASERRVLPIVGVCKTSSHLHIFSSSSHLHIFSSSHPHIFFSSSHLLIFSSSHLLIFTSSHLHIVSSSHLLTLTFSHPHILSSSFHSSSHLLILTSSPLAVLPSALLPSCPLALSFFSISLWKAGAGAVPTRQHETQPFRPRWSLIAENWGKIAISTCPAQPFRTKWGSIVKN